MTDIWPAAALSGHRDLTSQQGRWLRNELIRLTTKLRTNHGCETAHCGLAYGADTHFGYAALGAGLDLHAHIPYPQQSDSWASQRQRELGHPSRRQQEWCELRRRALQPPTVYGDLADVPEEARRAVAIRLLMKRNDGMVGAARSAGGVLLIAWDGRRSGGTWQVVDKVHPRGVAAMPVILLDLREQRVTLGINPKRFAGVVT